ncbi:50S ribosomal protein L11 methyltransferase [Convivina intestini]|uniref:Ribosomal protein L11 methyltransferase n=1 Tax=Convivina intestini TaxID=1505726 RepID=A0A2U1DEP9_9LACO|nr:50S ribosomal protein L11 methyltransferase [Convivina intestini]PVY86158.1 [LSU ribosomal protein L11P]-lysine N-methyltransferase [Convivina intestini]CAH1851413.1 Ribosomal protein L11 methyltransferase [Convivina intestini]SDB81140.1 ribosomal protein L11 methyltransferase [Leuconostocaceae bacterium R-53105]
MTWVALTYHVPVDSAELVADALVSNGATGVELADQEQTVDLTVYLEENDDFRQNYQKFDQALKNLQATGLFLPEITPSQRQLEPSDWENNWKEYYHASRITRQLTVVPAWEDYQRQQSDEKLIIMDPETAFGTGTHPTTSLMLQVVETIVRGGEKVLDVGTGSGVLAIAAKLLGVDYVLGTDIDQAAVTTAQQNLNLNPVAQDVDLVVSDLLKQVPDYDFDIIMANILADVIEPLIPQAKEHLVAGGYFLVSGIYEDQAAMIEKNLLNQGFKMVERLNRGPWYAYITQKEG